MELSSAAALLAGLKADASNPDRGSDAIRYIESNISLLSLPKNLPSILSALFDILSHNERVGSTNDFLRLLIRLFSSGEAYLPPFLLEHSVATLVKRLSPLIARCTAEGLGGALENAKLVCDLLCLLALTAIIFHIDISDCFPQPFCSVIFTAINALLSAVVCNGRPGHHSGSPQYALLMSLLELAMHLYISLYSTEHRIVAPEPLITDFAFLKRLVEVDLSEGSYTHKIPVYVVILFVRSEIKQLYLSGAGSSEKPDWRKFNTYIVPRLIFSFLAKKMMSLVVPRTATDVCTVPEPARKASCLTDASVSDDKARFVRLLFIFIYAIEAFSDYFVSLDSEFASLSGFQHYDTKDLVLPTSEYPQRCSTLCSLHSAFTVDCGSTRDSIALIPTYYRESVCGLNLCDYILLLLAFMPFCSGLPVHTSADRQTPVPVEMSRIFLEVAMKTPLISLLSQASNTSDDLMVQMLSSVFLRKIYSFWITTSASAGLEVNFLFVKDNRSSHFISVQMLKNMTLQSLYYAEKLAQLVATTYNAKTIFATLPLRFTVLLELLDTCLCQALFFLLRSKHLGLFTTQERDKFYQRSTNVIAKLSPLAATDCGLLLKRFCMRFFSLLLLLESSQAHGTQSADQGRTLLQGADDLLKLQLVIQNTFSASFGAEDVSLLQGAGYSMYSEAQLRHCTSLLAALSTLLYASSFVYNTIHLPPTKGRASDSPCVAPMPHLLDVSSQQLLHTISLLVDFTLSSPVTGPCYLARTRAFQRCWSRWPASPERSADDMSRRYHDFADAVARALQKLATRHLYVVQETRNALRQCQSANLPARSQLSAPTAAAASAHASFQELNDVIDRFNKREESLSGQIAALSAEVQEHRSTNMQLQITLKARDAAILQLEQSSNRLEAEAARLHAEVSDAHSKQTLQEASLREAHAQELHALRQMQERLTSSLDAAKSECAARADENQSLRTTLSEQRTAVLSLTEERDRMADEILRCREDVQACLESQRVLKSSMGSILLIANQCCQQSKQ